jgi:hypothetical protein
MTNEEPCDNCNNVFIPPISAGQALRDNVNLPIYERWRFKAYFGMDESAHMDKRYCSDCFATLMHELLDKEIKRLKREEKEGYEQ